LSVSDAVALSNQFIAERWRPFETNVELIPNRVDVYQYAENAFFLRANFLKCYYGIPFSDVKIIYNDSHVKNWTLTTNLYLDLFEPGKISLFCNPFGIFGDISMDELVEIVTLESALEITAKTLSGYMSYVVRYIALEYHYTDNAFAPEDHRGGGNAGTEYSAYPCWVIYFETDYNQEIYAIVNAQTGTFDFVDNQKL
jgi:hypothetical protein